MNSETRTRFTTLLVLLAVFGAGVAMGFALDRGIAIASPSADEASTKGEGGEERRGFIIDQLELPGPQRAQVDSVLDHYRGQMAALQDEFEEAFRPRSREVVAQTRAAIRAILNEEQTAAYDSLIAERNRRSSEGSHSDKGGSRN